MSVSQDVRFGIRTLLKSPAFTLVAVVTLALGIGANTAIFSLVNATMIRPLPYPNAARLMTIFHSYKKLNLSRATVDPNSYAYYRDHATSFETIAAFTSFRAPSNLTGAGDPERVRSVLATASLFPALGTTPLIGRTFTAAEDSPGNGRVAVLSYPLWNRRFGASRDVVGREITIDGANYTVIGVMPKGFEFPEKAELWLPICFTPEELATGSEYLNVVGTLRPGTSAAQAEAEMAKVSNELLVRAQDAQNVNGWSAVAMPLQQASVSEVRTMVWVLLGAVGCVLLIACANVASLLLARATARQKEIAIRSALGASRWRIARQLLTEGVLLGLTGGVLGLGLSYWGLDALLTVVPVRVPAYIHIEIDPLVLTFTLLLAIVTGLLFSAVPAVQVTHGEVNEILKDGGRTSGAAGHHLGRAAIVASQLALSMVLLVCAALLIKTFIRVQNSNIGFNPANVLTFRVTLPEAKYKQPAQMTAFFDQLLERERALPGVISASTTMTTPLSSAMTSTFTIAGKTFTVAPHVHVADVSPDYFKSMEIPLHSGRVFTPADREGGDPVAIIDENTARAYFQGEDPIGRKLMFTFEGTREKRIWRTIVGVVGSVKHTSPLETETKGQVFLPYAQWPIPMAIVVMRTTRDPLAIAAAATQQVRAVDPLQPVEEVQSMEDVLADFVAQPRSNMVLLGSFAGLALVLSMIGLYGVMAYSVTQRTHEFGVRMALGATSRDVLRDVLIYAVRISVIGLALGVVGALVATRFLSTMLFGVKPTDPVTFAAMTVLLIAIALLASYLPARRATKVDPMIALRYE